MELKLTIKIDINIYKTYTVKELTKILNVSDRTIQKYITDGLLKGEKRAGNRACKYVIKGEDVIKFLYSNFLFSKIKTEIIKIEDFLD